MHEAATPDEALTTGTDGLLSGDLEALARYAVETAPCPVLVVRDGAITRASSSALDFLGLSADKVLGRRFTDLVTENDRQLLTGALARPDEDVTRAPIVATFIAAGGRPTRAAVGVLGADASEDARRAVFVDSTGQTLKDPDQTAARLFVSRAVSADRHMLLTLDAEGRVVTMNQTLEALTGRRVNDSSGRPWIETFVPEEERERVADVLGEIAAGGRVHAALCPLIDAGGRKRLIDWTGVTIRSASGEPAGILCVGRDATDRVPHAETLRDPEGQLRLLIEEAEDLICLHDAEGHYRYFNGPERFGVTESDVIGRTPADLFPQEQSDPLLESIRRVARTGETLREVNRVEWQGEEIWFSDLIFPVHGPNGSVEAVGKICRNITDLKRREQAHAEETRRFRSLIERATDVILLLDPDATIRYASPAVQRAMGYAPGEVVGRNVSEFVVPDDLDDPLASFRLLISREAAPSTSLMRVHHKDGSIRWLEATSSDFLDDPAIHGVVVNARDITERRRAEEALRRRDAQHRRVLENLREGVWMIDRDAFTTYTNAAMERMLGYDRGEMLGKHLFDFMDGEWRTDCEARLARRSKGIDERHEFVFLKKNGEPLYASVSSSPVLDADGEYDGAIATVSDITKSKREREKREQLRKQLVQSQKMEAVGRLASGVAHDFNNFITAIMGYAEMALDKSGEKGPVREDIEQVLGAAEKASDLTGQLLLFSRERLEGDLVAVDAGELVSDLLKMLRRLIGEQIDLETSFQEAPCIVEVDRGAIEQVLVNLAVNARDAMPDGGILTVGTRCVTVGEREARAHPDATPGRYVAINVSDTGSGMTQDVVDRIFEPFFTTKEEGKGTGLGLSTSYGVVSSCGGWIGVESKPGRGSTFTVYLPASDSTPTKEEPNVKAQPKPRGRGRRVLCIEDERIVRVFSSSALETVGYEVASAATGAEAARIFRKATPPFDLIVCDMVLPDAHGLDLVRAFLKVQPDLRVIMATGYTDDPTAREKVESEGHRFLAKPYSSSDLTRAAAAVLDDDEAENAA